MRSFRIEDEIYIPDIKKSKKINENNAWLKAVSSSLKFWNNSEDNQAWNSL